MTTCFTPVLGCAVFCAGCLAIEPLDDVRTLDAPNLSSKEDSPKGWFFDASSEGWAIELANPPTLTAESQLRWTTADGDGGIDVNVPFSSSGQWLTVTTLIEQESDLSKAQVFASLRASEGKAAARVFIRSPGSLSAVGDFVALPQTLSTVRLDISAPSAAADSFDATRVDEVGIELLSTESGSITVHIDQVWYR